MLSPKGQGPLRRNAIPRLQNTTSPVQPPVNRTRTLVFTRVTSLFSHPNNCNNSPFPGMCAGQPFNFGPNPSFKMEVAQRFLYLWLEYMGADFKMHACCSLSIQSPLVCLGEHTGRGDRAKSQGGGRHYRDGMIDRRDCYGARNAVYRCSLMYNSEFWSTFFTSAIDSLTH